MTNKFITFKDITGSMVTLRKKEVISIRRYSDEYVKNKPLMNKDEVLISINDGGLCRTIMNDEEYQNFISELTGKSK